MAKGREALPKLPAGTWAILGLLTFGEQSGYDLKKLVDASVGHFFSPAKSQIYSELRRLVQLRYAREREIAQTDRPDKRNYTITPAGETALRRWLDESPLEEDSFKSPFLVKVFFGRYMDRDRLIEQVREYRDRSAAELAELEALEPTLRGQPFAAFPYLTLRAGLSSCRHSIRWCDEVLRALQEEVMT
ncbi:MAG: PadR family transcriptional regulator [Actinomycetota bacterium]